MHKKNHAAMRVIAVAAVIVIAACMLPFMAYASPEAVPMWGPYLTGVSGTGITVNWKTAGESDGAVEYAAEDFFSANGAYSHTATDSARELHHVTLTGLVPDTTYHYRVRIDDDHTADHTFRTLGDGPFTFIVYGDTREQIPYFTQLERHKLVADRIAGEEGISFIVHTGDFVCNADDFDEWQRFFDSTRQMLDGIPLFPVAGNHENKSPEYDEIFGMPKVYSFDCANAHFSVLDTNSGSDLDSQAEWLVEGAAGAADWRFAFFHHPPYTSDAQHWGGNIDLRNRWEPVLMETGVNAVFNAHVHAYERYYENGIHYMVVATGGAPFYLLADEKIPGYRNSLEYTLGYTRITVDGTEAFMDVIEVAGVDKETNTLGDMYPPDTVFERVDLRPEPVSDNTSGEPEPPDGDTPSIAISLDAELIDYGDIFPGESSGIEPVTISNNGTKDVTVTLEIQGDGMAGAFYEQSLYIDDDNYNPERVICSVAAGESATVSTRLGVPSSWSEPGRMEVTFVFWAEASP